MSEDELYRPLNSQGMNVFDIMEFHGMTGPVKIVKDVLAAKNAEIARLQGRNGHIDDGRVKLLEAHARTLQDTVNSLQADLEQARIFIKALDVTKLVAERDSLSRQNEELIAEVEDYKEKYCKWHNFTQDICTVFGDSTYTYVAMEGWLKKMCDADVLDRYLALADDVCKRLLKVKPHEWEDPVCKNSKSLCSF